MDKVRLRKQYLQKRSKISLHQAKQKNALVLALALKNICKEFNHIKPKQRVAQIVKTVFDKQYQKFDNQLELGLNSETSQGMTPKTKISSDYCRSTIF